MRQTFCVHTGVPEGMDQLEQGPSRAYFLACCSENGGPMVLKSIA